MSHELHTGATNGMAAASDCSAPLSVISETCRSKRAAAGSYAEMFPRLRYRRSSTMISGVRARSRATNIRSTASEVPAAQGLNPPSVSSPSSQRLPTESGIARTIRRCLLIYSLAFYSSSPYCSRSGQDLLSRCRLPNLRESGRLRRSTWRASSSARRPSRVSPRPHALSLVAPDQRSPGSRTEIRRRTTSNLQHGITPASLESPII